MSSSRGTSVVLASIAEPFTTSEAKTWLKVSHSVDDTLIDSMVASVRAQFETFTDRILINTTFDEVFDGFPAVTDVNPFAALYLTKGPVSSISSVSYIDDDGNTQVVSTDDYKTDLISVPARIMPTPSTTWADPQSRVGSVTVRYIAGYGSGSSSVPEDILQCLRLLLKFYYDQRDDIPIGKVTRTSDRLMAPYRVQQFY